MASPEEKKVRHYHVEELTGENIARIADEIEVKIQGGLAGRPLLSVPHITSDESSCYYHGQGSGGGCRKRGWERRGGEASKSRSFAAALT